MKNRIINGFKEIILIIKIIFIVSIIILSCGLALIVFDFVEQEEEYDDWILMEEYNDQMLVEE